MTTYEKIHSKKSGEGSTTEDTAVISSAEECNAEADERVQGDVDGQPKDVPKTIDVMVETSGLSEVKENQCLDSYVSDPNSQDTQEMQNSYSYTQDGEEYPRLLNEYYEIEEKRQKIIEKLYQFGGGNYQYWGEGSGSGVQWGTASGYEQDLVPANQPSNPAVVVGSCCPYMCPCLTTPCSACPACSSVQTCAGISFTGGSLATNSVKPLSQEDENIVKTAMGTAERALSSMKTKVTGDSSTTKVEKEKDAAEMAETNCSETDISAVLNAWYSAGFYTGKYLVEQSIEKKRQS